MAYTVEPLLARLHTLGKMIRGRMEGGGQQLAVRR
jgi:hypothetical protein